MGEWGVEAVKQRRAAVFIGDGSIVDVVRGRLTDDVLQLAGDGLLEAVARGVADAAEMAADCAAMLRERDWAGDEELTDQLEAALNQGAVPLLRPLPIDLEELASLLEGDPLGGGGRIDLKTGECRPYSSEYDEDEDEDEDEDHWLWVQRVGSHDGYRDIELFIATVENAEIVDRLEIAIPG